MFVGDIPEEPLDLFLLFWTPAVLESIVEQTNLYAQQQGSHFETSQQELRAFLGVLIRMSLVMAASLHLYWDREGPCTLVSNVFSRERFELMRRYLHLNDNTQMPESGSAHFDPLFKVHPLLDAVRQRFMQLFVPDSSLCIDETLMQEEIISSCSDGALLFLSLPTAQATPQWYSSVLQRRRSEWIFGELSG